MSLLSTKSLSKNYSGLQAVSDVNFDLPAGQVRALIGPNGAGKTTFVGMLSGRITASSGSVTFNDRDVTNIPAHQRLAMGMAYTFQITSVFSKLSVHENVALAARCVIDGNSKAVNTRVMEVLERVKLDDRHSQIAGDLSYGHQRLLEIAMGLAQKPTLFILDEPTQGLAESEINDFVSLIETLSADTTILLTVLNFGEVLAEGTPNEIRANEQVQTAYLGNQ